MIYSHIYGRIGYIGRPKRKCNPQFNLQNLELVAEWLSPYEKKDFTSLLPVKSGSATSIEYL